MASRIETQFGTAKGLGTTYTQIGAAIVAGHLFNLHLNVTNILATDVKLRAFIADTSWASGAPTGGTKVACISYDLVIAPGSTQQITGVILAATQKLVVQSDTASGLDIIASGVDVTL